MIFGSSSRYKSKQRHKITAREVNAAELAIPQYLRWSELVIFFDWTDHPEHVPHPRKFPLVVDPLVRNVRLTKVLMDGGSGLNILYVKTLDNIKISRSDIKPTGAPFDRIVPGKTAKPLGKITLEVTFGTPANFRMEIVTFEVVDFWVPIPPSWGAHAMPSS